MTMNLPQIKPGEKKNSKPRKGHVAMPGDTGTYKEKGSGQDP